MKKLLAVLLALAAVLSLSAAAFADTTNFEFNPSKLYAPEPEPDPEPVKFAWYSLEDQLANTKAAVKEILDSKLTQIIPTNEYTANCYIEVDPEAEELADQFVVRRVVVKETEETPYCKQYYFNKDGSLLFVQYDTKNGNYGDRHRFYFANRTEGENVVTELLLCKINVFAGDKVTLLTEGDENFDTIESSVLAEGEEILAAAQEQLQLLQEYGMYKNIL